MVEVKLHDIGEGMTEGDILTYFVKEGDYVKEDQPLVEVQTEKMVAELTSPVKGKVKRILIEPEKTISVGTTVITIEEEGAAVSRESKQSVTQQEVAQTQYALKTDEAPISVATSYAKAAPYTRKIAREHNVNLESVQGSGRRGRITVEDVYRYIENEKGLESKLSQHQLSQPTEPVIEKKEPLEPDDFEVIPFKGRRKQIAKKMTTSLYTIPHVAHFEEVDMTNLLNYRKELKELDVSISVAAFFIKALSISLKKYRVFNAKLDEDKGIIKLEQAIHMGLATDTEEGLIVPVLRNVEKKSLRHIHDEMKQLTKKAQENKLALHEMTGSTFTISNVGPLGSIGATPIINYPETGLMAFHKTKKMPVVNEQDEIVIRSMMNITMTFDHRVADGGTVVAFTNHFKALIENPKLLTLELV